MALQRHLIEQKLLELLHKKHPTIPATKEEAEIRCEEMKRNAQKPGYPFQEACSELTDWRSWIKLLYFEFSAVIELLLKCRHRKLDPRQGRDGGELFKKERLAPLISLAPCSVLREPEIKSVFRDLDLKSAFLESLFETFGETLDWMQLQEALETPAERSTPSGREQELDQSLPSHNRLIFDKAQQRVRIDGIWENLSDEGCKMWATLWEAKGERVPGKDISERAAKIKFAMPPRVRAEIESHKRRGYWLRRFVRV